MKSTMDEGVGSIRAHRVGAAVLVSLLVPPLITAAGTDGGAAFDLGGVRTGWIVEWFQLEAAAAAFLGCALWMWMPAPANRTTRVGFGIAGLGFFISTGVLWTGGLEVAGVSIRHGLNPAIVGWVGLAVALVGSRRRLRVTALRPSMLVVIAVALAAGGGLHATCMQLDRAATVATMIARPSDRARGDVILIVIDALRADALSAYGAKGSDSLFLDRFAKESIVFEMAVSQAPRTVPSMASLMTGLYPSTLDASGASWDDVTHYYRFPPATPRLAERFRAAGFHTAGFVKNPFLGTASEYGVGFDLYREVPGDSAQNRSGAQLTGAALRWARAFAKRRANGVRQPFLLYLHFMDSHIDYLAPPRFRPDETFGYHGPLDGKAKSLERLLEAERLPTPEGNAYLKALYRGEVAYLDTQLARLEAGLSELGLWEDAIVVFLADHGEQFGEHGNYMHGNLHIENVHVPLLIRGPGIAPRRITRAVGNIDVLPTLLEWLQLPPIEFQEGRSLVPMLRGSDDPAEPSRAEITEHRRRNRVTALPYALIVGEGGPRLYDLSSDPGETHDLAIEKPEIVAQLSALFDSHRGRRSAAAAVPRLPGAPVDSETQRKLRALGYVEDRIGDDRAR